MHAPQKQADYILGGRAAGIVFVRINLKDGFYIVLYIHVQHYAAFLLTVYK